MFNLFPKIVSLPVPKTDSLAEHAVAPFFRDALQAPVSHLQLSPSQLQYAVFNYLPNWVKQLMRLRNAIVKQLGFDVGQDNMAPKSDEMTIGDQAGFLTVISKTPDEIISYADDRHMTFYLSVKKQANSVVISTLVNKKTWLGRLYVNAILPFHYIIARTVINNAIKAGRL